MGLRTVNIFPRRFGDFTSFLSIASHALCLGNLIQKLNSPRRKSGALGKVYQVQLQNMLNGTESATFASGKLMLRSETKECKPAKLEVIDPIEKLVQITLYEGRYHQLRRMLAAVGNRAVSIHRVQTGPVKLGDLPVRPFDSLSCSF